MDTLTLTDRNRRHGKPAWLRADAARSYERMKKHHLPADCISDAGRTYAEQKEMWEAYLRGELPATAARPGTSKHETGIALDVREPGRAWVRSRGHEHGWIKDRVRNEPWHMEYDPAKDRYPWRKVKVTGHLDVATSWAVCRATGRRVTRPSTPAGFLSFWKAVQRTLNRDHGAALKVDGAPGPKTIRALQASLRRVNGPLCRPKVDGSLGPATVRAWQHALNAAKWGRTKKQINA